ncbi:hypothetical protein [Prosthecomicrobium sp. N25]|uniref:hypothetical protein n=1 Tax=Prosthecomicrobium sp. N25 TaxID=3129254 RepID=UPI0030771B33
MTDRTNEKRAVRRPAMDRRWSPAIEARVLDIVARTGSPKMASEAVGVSVATIHDHRRRDTDFGARYGAAMDTAFHQVLSKAFERSMADEEPSDRLIEVLLKFRWPERLNGFLAFTAEGGSAATAPAGLDPRVIARMEPADRAALIELLGRYLVAETEAKGDAALLLIN